LLWQARGEGLQLRATFRRNALLQRALEHAFFEAKLPTRALSAEIGPAAGFLPGRIQENLTVDRSNDAHQVAFRAN
jgi:hypothetical protein